MVFHLFRAVCFLVVVGLAACGGGGGSDDVSTPPPAGQNPVQGVSFQPGVFPNSASLEAQCETPRTGTDPFTNAPFPDRQGSEFLEKMWLRSWTFESYLWFDEVEDRDPANFGVIEYFNLLRTEALTDSGRPRDNFHFSQNTAEFNQLTQSGITRGYGFNFQRNRSSAPREFIVRFTEPGSAAEQAGVPRGALLTSVDGVDFISSSDVNTINTGLFPSEPGATHEFGFRLQNGSEITVSLVSEDVLVSPVQNVSLIETDFGPVGYMQFNAFNVTAQPALIDAFEQFSEQNVSELVIDLRYNGGGRLALASQLGYMIAGEQSQGSAFEVLQFNGKFMPNEPTPFFDREIDYNEGVFLSRQLPSSSLSRVFVLSTENTCSASESLINGLRGIGVEVVLIGDTTCGKPFGFFPTDNCGTTYFTIQFQSINAVGFGDYQDGFVPSQNPLVGEQVQGCEVEDDFSQALGNENEALLATALGFMVDGVAACPPVLAESRLVNRNREAGRETRKDIIIRAIANESRETIREAQ